MPAKKSSLGANPLTQGIFSRTSVAEPPEEVSPSIQESRIKNQESIKKNQESIFLAEMPSEDLENVNLRIPPDLNDRVNALLTARRRKKKTKIRKERIFQAALEFLLTLPIDLEEVESEEELREFLIQASRIKIKE